MSYSFNVRAATKAAAKELVVAEYDRIVHQQDIHAKDRDQAQAAANAFIDVLTEDAEKDIDVRVNGSVSWTGDIGAAAIVSASVSVSAHLVAKAAAA